MTSSLNPLARFQSAVESGLMMAQSAMASAQRTIEQMTGQSTAIKGAPVNGPEDVDLATADFANRLMRIARYSPKELAQLPAAGMDLIRAARESFRYLDLTDPRNLAFPVQLALSMGTLMTESALRGMVTIDVVGLGRFPQLASDFFQMFTETPVFANLEYDNLIERCETRLETHPDDEAARLELARVFSKCGRYDDAVREFRMIPKSSGNYAVAMHEAAAALYRAGRYEKAVQSEVESMDADPSSERARSILFLASRRLGGYPTYVPQAYRMELKAGLATPTVEFEDIAAKIGLDKTSAGRGTAIFDYDGDGYLDLIIASAHGGTNVYHNNGDGTFTDVSVGSGLDIATNSFAPVVGDYNNDGLPDLYITRAGFYVGEGQLFRNNGDGTFTDVTAEAGLKAWGPGFTASWADYDNDGYLDLFIANNLGGLFERKTPNRLFHNNGDGTFTEVTEQAGLHTIWPTIGGAWGDYDNDGRLDLFLSNGLGRSQLYHNNGDGTFTDVSDQAGITALGFGSPTFWWDYDNDGWLDLAQYIWSDHDEVIYTMRHGEGPKDGYPTRIYHNNRDGTFTMVSEKLGLKDCWGTMSGNFGDFNNDGNLDLVFGNGSPKLDRMEPMIIMEFDGSKFHNTTFAAGLPLTGKSHGINMGDLFGDGRLSIITAGGGAYPGDLLATSVFYPKTLPGNFLNVRLVGMKSNKTAIGSRLMLEIDGRKQYRQICGGSNFGCLPYEQHFGLGKADGPVSLEIRWPSGLVQRFEGISCNTTLQFTEGSDTWDDVYKLAAARKAAKAAPGASQTGSEA